MTMWPENKDYLIYYTVTRQEVEENAHCGCDHANHKHLCALFMNCIKSKK